eukprot:2294384-Amphidinium_carterae.1
MRPRSLPLASCKTYLGPKLLTPESARFYGVGGFAITCGGFVAGVGVQFSVPNTLTSTTVPCRPHSYSVVAWFVPHSVPEAMTVLSFTSSGSGNAKDRNPSKRVTSGFRCT